MVHNKVWGEAVKMRSEGKFIEMIKELRCPVFVIHGEYDPHPFDGINDALKGHTREI